MPPERNPSTRNVSATTVDITLVLLIAVIVLGFLGAYITTATEGYFSFVQWFYSGNWHKIKQIVMLIFIFFDVLLAIWIGITIRQMRILNNMVLEKEGPAQITLPEEVAESWKGIMELVNSINPSDWNMAVLRADALFDDILAHLGYQGTTLAERLKIVDPLKLPSLDRVWSAHRLRNIIAHDPIQNHTKEMVVHAVGSYEQAFKELGMIKEKINKDTFLSL